MVELKQVECKYCGKMVELRNTVKLNPETEEYEYAREHCAMRLELDSYKEDPSQIE